MLAVSVIAIDRNADPEGQMLPVVFFLVIHVSHITGSSVREGFGGIYMCSVCIETE